MSSSRYKKRRSTSQGNYRYAPEKNNKETITTQCIVCGAALVFILLINLINSEFTRDIKISVSAAISENMTAGDVKDSLDKTWSTITGIRDNVSFLLGGTQNENQAVDVFLHQTPPPQFQPQATPAAQLPVLPLGNNRIDEDILQEILERRDYYGVLQSKNFAIPAHLQ
jgi:hypothetical protein